MPTRPLPPGSPRLQPLDLGWAEKLNYRKSGRSHPNEPLAALEREWYQKLAAAGFKDIEPKPWTLKSNSYLTAHWLTSADSHASGIRTAGAERARLVYKAMHVATFPSMGIRAAAAWIASEGVSKEAAMRALKAREVPDRSATKSMLRRVVESLTGIGIAAERASEVEDGSEEE